MEVRELPGIGCIDPADLRCSGAPIEVGRGPCRAFHLLNSKIPLLTRQQLSDPADLHCTKSPTILRLRCMQSNFAFMWRLVKVMGQHMEHASSLRDKAF